MSLALKVWNSIVTTLATAVVIAKDAVALSNAFEAWKKKWAVTQVVVSIAMAGTIDGDATVEIFGSADGTNFDTVAVDNMGGTMAPTAGATVQKSFLVYDLYAFKVAVTNGTSTAGNMTVTITARPYRWES